ncbi:MAG: hypothetical protein V4617_05475 [Gemmatimonadota bacterium]
MPRATRLGCLLASGAALASTVACASRSVAPELSTPRMSTQTIQVAGGASANVSLVNNSASQKAILDLTPDQAFAATERAFAALAIPVTDRDAGLRRVGNMAFRTRRKVGDLLMTKVVDCGGDTGMPNAETYTVTLTILSQITPNDAGGSVIQTLVEGSAVNPLTNASNAVRCSSVGGLEARIKALLSAK